MQERIKQYLNEIRRIRKNSNAREMSYRTNLENLIKDICPNILPIQDGKRIKDVGAPDFVFLKNDFIPIGYIETKLPAPPPPRKNHLKTIT